MPVSKKLTASAAVSRFSEYLTYSETRQKAASAKRTGGRCTRRFGADSSAAAAAQPQTIGVKSR